MCPDDKTIKIVDQLWVARLCTSDRKVGRGSPVKLAKLADLKLRQTTQARSAKHSKKVFEPLPIIFSFVDESIHYLEILVIPPWIGN
jgi:hypothetical protein